MQLFRPDPIFSKLISGVLLALSIGVICLWLSSRNDGNQVGVEEQHRMPRDEAPLRTPPEKLKPKAEPKSEPKISEISDEFRKTLNEIPRREAPRYVTRFLDNRTEGLTFEEGLSLLDIIDDVALYDRALQLIILKLGSQDLESLEEFADSLDSRNPEVWATVGSALGMASSNHPIPTIVKESGNAEFIGAFMRKIGFSESRDLIATAGTLDSSLRDRALREGITGLLDSDFQPNQDAEFQTALSAASAIDSIEEKKLATGKIAQAWIRQDPLAASEWVDSLSESDEELFATAVPQVVLTWYGDDPLSCSKWLTAVPEGRARDAGASNIAKLLIRTSPDEAIAWAESIGDEELRRETLAAVSRP